MVARVGTITSMVEGLLDTLSTSCELIWVFFNALWQRTGPGGLIKALLVVNLLAGWRVVDL